MENTTEKILYIEPQGYFQFIKRWWYGEDKRTTFKHLDTYFTELLTNDEVPNETYKPAKGSINSLDYEMKVEEYIFISDSLVINTDVIGTSINKSVPTDSANKIKEESLSAKGKQDKKPSKPVTTRKPRRKIREKTNEFSNPFGDLG